MFALLLPDTDQDGARLLMAKLSEALHQPVASGGAGVTCSIGVATFMQPPEGAKQAINAADHLMYEVKKDGKGAVAYRIFGTAPLSVTALEDLHPPR